MLGMGYRTDLNQVKQFERNISEVTNWLDTTDDALSEAVNVLQRIRELTVQASNGTYEENQREAIAVEVKQLKDQLLTIAKTQVGDKYIFNGTNTANPPEIDQFSDGEINIEIFEGITVVVNSSGKALFENLISNSSDGGSENDPIQKGVLNELIADLENGATDAEIGAYLSELDHAIDHFLKMQAEVGAKQNRVELMQDRIATQEVTATKILSENEDVDMEIVITQLITQEAVHRAALSAGARIIQPTLLDFYVKLFKTDSFSFHVSKFLWFLLKIIAR